MKVTANSAFRAVHQCQILELAAGAPLDGDIAAYLMRTGADVSPADDEAETYADELEQRKAELAAVATDALPEVVQTTEEPGTPVVEERPADQANVEIVGGPVGEQPADVSPADEGAGQAEQIDVANSKISDVMAWVGDDAERALAAFDAESARGDDARSTLLDQLTKIVEA